MLGLLPLQGAASLSNQYHRALPWAKSKPCPFRAQADKTIFRKAQQAKASRFFRAFRVRKKKNLCVSAALRLKKFAFASLKNRRKPIKTYKNKCFILFSFVLIGFSKWRKQLIINN